jgi:phosphoribosylformimino-5-aminoimidazole carboxamide ribonucleotide (ProFAR) isomerase
LTVDRKGKPMVVIPTIDVRGGRCVRAAQGEYAQPTVYAGDPAILARNFIDEGATRLHVVDLDAARGIPAPESAEAVARIHGWTEDGVAATELLRRWKRWRAAGLVYTDTTRDGMLSGPNLDGLQICRDLYGGPVIVAGGVGSLEDIAACAAAGATGVLVGRALTRAGSISPARCRPS